MLRTHLHRYVSRVEQVTARVDDVLAEATAAQYSGQLIRQLALSGRPDVDHHRDTGGGDRTLPVGHPSRGGAGSGGPPGMRE